MISSSKLSGSPRHDAPHQNVGQNVTQGHVGYYNISNNNTYSNLTKTSHSKCCTEIIEGATSEESIVGRDVKCLCNNMTPEDNTGNLGDENSSVTKRGKCFTDEVSSDIKRRKIDYNNIDCTPNNTKKLSSKNNSEVFSEFGNNGEWKTYCNIVDIEEDDVLAGNESIDIEVYDIIEKECGDDNNEINNPENNLLTKKEEGSTDGLRNTSTLEQIRSYMWGHLDLKHPLTKLYSELNNYAEELYNLTKGKDCKVVRENKRYVITYSDKFIISDKEKVEGILKRVNGLLKEHTVRVKAEKLEGSKCGSGLDELFKTSETLEFFFRSTGLVEGVEPYSQWSDGKTINWLDLQLNLRIPTYAVLFNNGEGHTGALYDKKNGDKLTGQKTKGQAKEHEKRQAVIARSKTPLVAAERALRHMHQIMMINTANFKAARGKDDSGNTIAIYQEKIYNIWANDLSTAENRNDFSEELSVIRTNIARIRNFIRDIVLNSSNIITDKISDTRSLKDSVADPMDLRLFGNDFFDVPSQPSDDAIGG